MVKQLIIAGSSAFFLIVSVVLLWGVLSQPAYCSSPVFWGTGDYHPTQKVVALLQQLGGFPKSSGELFAPPGLSKTIYPVTAWQIEEVIVDSPFPLWQRILDDDPTYGIEIDIRVDYADGDKGLIRWSTWQYGLVICPLVQGGDGPPGRLEVISLSSG